MRYQVTLEGRVQSAHPTKKAAEAAAKAITAGSVKIIDLDPQDPPKTKKK